MENTKLIHRLNIAQGQIEAIKKTLLNGEEKDCLKIMNLLKASINALKKFGDVYTNQNLIECIDSNEPKDKLKESLKQTISSAFDL